MLRIPNASLRDSVHYGGGHISMLFVLSAVAVSLLITDRNGMSSRQWEATPPASLAASEQSDASDQIAADAGLRDPTTETMLLQIQACCLPQGICFELDYMPCVTAGGDPQGPGTSCWTLPDACSPLKWSQPPTFSPMSPEPNCFWGWDELSHYDCCQIVADDFLCVTPEPITNVHWWGSYRGWLGQEPPIDAPPAFHIGIWTDVPAGTPSDETCCYCWNPPGVIPAPTCSPNPPDQATCDLWGGGQYQQCTYMPNSRCVVDHCEPLSPLPYSHPGTMIHQWVVTREVLRERPVGCDFHPEFPPGDTCFKYDFEIPEADWFYQPASPIENIFWVSISAMYGPTCACNGDVNGDGLINAADLASLLACIGLPPNPPCDRADINCDGVINPADVAALQCLIVGGLNCCPGTTPPPVTPWGWKTREHFFQDDAVVILDPHAPSPSGTFIEGYPIERPPGLSWDMSFTLTTERPEACCINDLAGPFCTNVLPSQCTPQGIPQGPGTVCSGTTIACCLPNGTCEDVDPLCCDDLGGTPSGSAVACMGDLNSNGVDDACEVPCEPMPDGSQCRPTICPNILDTCVPTRVYCPPTGDPCTVMNCECRPGQICHVDLDAQRQPVCVSWCPEFEICEPVISVNPDGSTETECHCAPIPLEACCFVDGSCQMLIPDHCLSIDGTPQGLGTSCNFITQACCLPNGSCSNVDPLCCDDMGGTPSTGSLSCLTDLSGNGVDDACEILDRVVCEPQGGLSPFHPPVYWYDVTPTGFGRCDFHVRVRDPNPTNYTNWNITPWPGNTWQFLVHQVGAEWWASWWDSDSGCPNAIFGPTRFEFTNASPSTWSAWTTTISNTSDPYLQIVDSSMNHPAQPDGLGYRVHVPLEVGCEPNADRTACIGPCPIDPEVCLPTRIQHHVPSPGFPEAGIDMLSPTMGYVDIRDPLGDVKRYHIDPEQSPNITRIQRSNAVCVSGHRSLDAEIIETQLVADGPGGMSVMIRESPTRASSGRVVGPPGCLGDYPADSFFDIFVEIDIPGMGILGLQHVAPIPMLATGVQTIPPYGATYHSLPGWPGVELLDPQGNPTGFMIVEAEHEMPGEWEIVECSCTDPNTCHVERTPGFEPVCVGGCPEGQQCSMRVAMIDPATMEYACECIPLQACCLSNDQCVEITHMDCVAQGGDPMGPGTDCDTVVCAEIKWSQPPVFNPFSPHPECFYGWDEISIHGLWQIVADDWLCTTEQPITDIHWWGSYLGWSGVEPPPPPYLTPTAFHIGIWTDFPGGIFSHPDMMIWEWIVPRSALNERPVACNFHPEHNFTEPDGCFRYDFLIPPNQWFHQGPVDAIYWISISAMYDEVPCACNGDVNGDGFVNLSDMAWLMNCIAGAPIDCSRADVNCDGQISEPADTGALACLLQGLPHDQCCPPFTPVYAWGWKTRLPSWNDDAVRITEPTAPRTGIPPMPPLPRYLAGTPIENQEGSWDMSFVLTTQPAPCVTDADCVRMDADVCTCDQCVDGVCVHTPIEFGNVDCSVNQQPNLDDILCVLLGFSGFDNCPNGDIHPYCTGNDVINLDDILAVLAAFGGFDPCNCQP